MIKRGLEIKHHKNESHYCADQQEVIDILIAEYAPDALLRRHICQQAEKLVREIRSLGNLGLMEVFLAEYGLSTDEGIALMCLAEALLRVPDAETIDELIKDKIAPSSWGEHLGRSSSSLVNASTWALMLTGKILHDRTSKNLADTLHGLASRVGEPVIRALVKKAMQKLGRQFVLGQTIEEATQRAKTMEDKGYTYSYDMLGEAAITQRDADDFFASYRDAITHLAEQSTDSDISKNAGISIKLSALHPRYEFAKKNRVIEELAPRLKRLCLMAKEAGMGLNIDAEEADRLDLSLEVIEYVIRSPEFTGWDGFGVVVQAYGKRAAMVINRLYAFAEELDRRFMVRLVKGAYWDTEIKHAQVEGHTDFPVFTQKSATDISYICCAKKLLDYADRLYPQFATHNAHTVSAIVEMAEEGTVYEFQRLHGMGEALHRLLKEKHNTRCRIYAPVGAHKDLLAYLVRRLLENGANSSFVNQLIDLEVPPKKIVEDPFVVWQDSTDNITRPKDLFGSGRVNSAGWNLRDIHDVARYKAVYMPFMTQQWQAASLIKTPKNSSIVQKVLNPSRLEDCVGTVSFASADQIESALHGAVPWNVSPEIRARILQKISDLYEEHSGEFFAVLCREAGKTASDAVAEVREAVDFLRYYSIEAKGLGDKKALGIISCISPWNFPLAIFTGQIAAALAAGNGVIAKPAEATPIVAHIASTLIHQAGVPENVFQLLLGQGKDVGRAITTDSRIHGICFTGSTSVAQTIYQDSAKILAPDACFIAETGGLNAMIVDSTALPEQAIKDIIDSAFRSAGQRCSALRLLYVQKDIEKEFLEMLYGAMAQLAITDPQYLSCDVGPIITQTAQKDIRDYIDQAKTTGRLLRQEEYHGEGYFVPPSVIRVSGIQELKREIFGPVLHVATFGAEQIGQIINDINQRGFGLTFGLHTRIDARVEYVTRRLKVGNMYVNRNQIGAIVGSQPFGGEGLSGTGPKAGGKDYVTRFTRHPLPKEPVVQGAKVDPKLVQSALKRARTDTRRVLETINMPGPTGESNRLTYHPKGTILCLGPTRENVQEQIKLAQEKGCNAVGVAPNLTTAEGISGFLERKYLSELQGFAAVALWSDLKDLQVARIALSQKNDAIIPLIATNDMHPFCTIERHLCVDTTAAGGNASLLAEQ